MLLINAVLKHEAKEAKEVIRDASADIRLTLAQATGHKLDDIALIPRILSEEETCLAQNIPPLLFLIKLGSRPEVGVSDLLAQDFAETLVLRIPRLKKIHFGAWLISNEVNGCGEYSP